MPIDPRIPLAVETPPPIDVGQAISRGLQIRALMDEAKANAQARADEQATRQILAQSGGNLDSAIERLYQNGQVPAAMKLETIRDARRKAQLEQLSTTLDLEKKRYGVLAQDANTITDQASQDAALARMDPATRQVAQQVLGPTYDPEKVARAKQITLTAKESADLRHQALVDWKDSAKTAQDGVKTLAGFLAGTPPDHWGQTVQAAGALGIPKEAIDFVQANVQTPEQAKALAIGPEKQADLARQAATAAETARHNQASEAVSAGNLAIRKQELALDWQKRADALKKGVNGVKLPAATAQVVAGLEQSEDILTELQKLKKDEWLGPAAGRWTETKISVPGMTVPEDLARFAAQTATLKNSVIKAITGAQMSEPEAKRIMGQIPMFTDKPVVWEQKAKATLDNVQKMRARILSLSGAGDGETETPEPSRKRFEIVSVQ